MVLDFIVSMFVLVGIISLFNLTRNLLKIRKIIKMHKDNPNIQGISIINGEVKVIEKKTQEAPKTQTITLVTDEICQKQVNKEEAYRVVVDEKEHYFCSWECREAFIHKMKQEGK